MRDPKSKFTGRAVFAAFFALTLFAIVTSFSVKVNVKFAPRDLAFGQAASYQYVTMATGVPVNGKISVVPTTQTLDTQTTVAAGTLNGTNSPVYDVSQLNERARMINIGFGVTAVPGTSPSLTPSVQESDDGGQNWYQVYSQQGTTFSAVTTVSTVTGLDFPIYGDLLRVHYVSSGTGNFTFTDNAKQSQ